MRRFIILVITAVIAVVLLPVAPANAGGPTSVLVVDHDSRHAAGALTGSPAYDSLARALDIENPPKGDPTSPDSFMASSIRLTWLIHDVQPWRVDALTIEGSDVWVSTLLMQGGETLFSAAGSPPDAVWHRPANTALLLKSLTDLGVLGGNAAPSAPATAIAIAPVTASAPTEPSTPGVPPAALAVVAVLSLCLGGLAGRSWRLRRRDASSSESTATATEVRATPGVSTAAYETGREHLKGFTLR